MRSKWIAAPLVTLASAAAMVAGCGSPARTPVANERHVQKRRDDLPEVCVPLRDAETAGCRRVAAACTTPSACLDALPDLDAEVYATWARGPQFNPRLPGLRCLGEIEAVLAATTPAEAGRLVQRLVDTRPAVREVIRDVLANQGSVALVEAIAKDPSDAATRALAILSKPSDPWVRAFAEQQLAHRSTPAAIDVDDPLATRFEHEMAASAEIVGRIEDRPFHGCKWTDLRGRCFECCPLGHSHPATPPPPDFPPVVVRVGTLFPCGELREDGVRFWSSRATTIVDVGFECRAGAYLLNRQGRRWFLPLALHDVLVASDGRLFLSDEVGRLYELIDSDRPRMVERGWLPGPASSMRQEPGGALRFEGEFGWATLRPDGQWELGRCVPEESPPQ